MHPPPGSLIHVGASSRGRYNNWFRDLTRTLLLFSVIKGDVWDRGVGLRSSHQGIEVPCRVKGVWSLAEAPHRLE